MKKGMTEKEFNEWKKEWFQHVPKCSRFNCVHELMTCGIDIMCGHCSLYETYARQKDPIECTNVGCVDCAENWACRRTRKKR